MIAKPLSLFIAAVLWSAFPVASAGEAGTPRNLFPVGEPNALPSGRVRRVEMNHALEISAALPEFDNPAINEEIRGWLGRLLAAVLPQEGGDVARPADNAALSIWIDYRLSQPADQAVSVVIETSWHAEGAAHPASFVDILNFSLPDGQVLRIDTLFGDPERALAIFAKLSPGLVAEKLRRENPDVFADLNDPDDVWLSRDGFAPTRENYSVLGLEPGGVRVHFGEYQVLAYAFGKPDVLIPLSALAPAGPNPDIWPAGAGTAP
ncbi:MAG: RsiV family protein [Planctomycetota bacterium]|jgi:hypothetical protein|nr:RsiV family protein [Planctomycetota bacterium]